MLQGLLPVQSWELGAVPSSPGTDVVPGNKPRTPAFKAHTLDL